MLNRLSSTRMILTGLALIFGGGSKPKDIYLKSSFDPLPKLSLSSYLRVFNSTTCSSFLSLRTFFPVLPVFLLVFGRFYTDGMDVGMKFGDSCVL